MSDHTTTNDPQPAYGRQPKREPLLSDDELFGMIPTRFDAVQPKPNGMSVQGCKAVRDFYEYKIASGELMVVKTCNNVGYQFGCGSKIIEP